MDKGAWWATVHGVTKSWTWLSDLVCTHAMIFLSLFMSMTCLNGVQCWGRGIYSRIKVVHYKYNRKTLSFMLSDWLKFRMLKRTFVIPEKEPSVDRVSYSWSYCNILEKRSLELSQSKKNESISLVSSHVFKNCSVVRKIWISESLIHRREWLRMWWIAQGLADCSLWSKSSLHHFCK